ncbi:type II toxin-antitoxin system VapC family toxin [Caulobacter segnis]|uniref:Ribonuclease VapC n=1 Tax=Caulobacter segnis TaxID=88688 RepID=A0A2W5V5N9_9CAUL|nr:type II toxin-antitoxin system VapC family toxin [Caulobacter segnis]PZR35150.1 MAG: PIN domain nuclease [Caulobacter segnis]
MRLVVDTSALVAIITGEPERAAFLGVLAQGDEMLLSEINYAEAGIVLVARGYLADQQAFDTWLEGARIQVAREPALHEPALKAYLAYGKGRHPAGLNLADSFAYALAKTLDAPLLYKGDDFALTDIRAAL